MVVSYQQEVQEGQEVQGIAVSELAIADAVVQQDRKGDDEDGEQDQARGSVPVAQRQQVEKPGGRDQNAHPPWIGLQIGELQHFRSTVAQHLDGGADQEVVEVGPILARVNIIDS